MHKKSKKLSAQQSQDHLRVSTTGIHLNLWIYTTGESPAGGNTLLPEEVHKQQHPEST